MVAAAIPLCLTAAQGAAPARAQQRPPTPVQPTTPLVIPGGLADEWTRILQLRGALPAEGYLLRSPSSLAGAAPVSGARLQLLPPEADFVHSSELPADPPVGAAWAGRGWSGAMTAGVRFRLPWLTATAAPTVGFLQNLDYPILAAQAPGRDSLSSRWYAGRTSIDLPQRFGTTSETTVNAGQSSLVLHAGPVDIGAGTESQWWGPGARNALLLSSAAPGVPHLFLRPNRPIETRLGRIQGKWVLGVLSESEHFDSVAANDRRSYAAAALTFSPVGEPGLTLGVARAVYAAIDGSAAVLGRALDPFTRFRAAAPEPRGAGEGHDQLSTVFARWLFPRDGVEVYAELARQELPRSVRAGLTDPNHSQGYTVGGQWVAPARGAMLRLHGEATYLEQSNTFTQRPTPTFYVSRAVPQGYTHRGRVLGAAIGPGSSSQWLAAEVIGGRVRGGLFASRTRLNNDAYYQQQPNLSYAHDVALVGGARAAVRIAGFEWSVQATRERRYNYLFQNRSPGFEGEKAVDIANRTLRLSVRPLGAG